MGVVRAEVTVPGRVSGAEALWYDTRRWPTFVDGLHHVDKVEGEWPHRGARVVWDSHPGTRGRGRVVETVTAFEARRGQTVRVEDERLRGERTVTFAPAGDAVHVTLELRYTVKQEAGIPAVVDLVLVRRPARETLRRTLVRFARELRADG